MTDGIIAISTAEWVKGLAERLLPEFVPARMNFEGGHDRIHVERMISMGPRIKEACCPALDLTEFECAVLLHNIDRHPHFQESISALGLHGTEGSRADTGYWPIISSRCSSGTGCCPPMRLALS